jgi:hypothetical protein
VVKLKGRVGSTNIEDRRISDSSMADMILKDMKKKMPKRDSVDAWTDMMSPKPINPTHHSFQKNMKTGNSYSFQKVGSYGY